MQDPWRVRTERAEKAAAGDGGAVSATNTGALGQAVTGDREGPAGSDPRCF